MISIGSTVLRRAFQRCTALRLNADNVFSKLTVLPGQSVPLSLSVSHFRSQTLAPRSCDEKVFTDNKFPYHTFRCCRHCTSDEKQKTGEDMERTYTPGSVEGVVRQWAERMEHEDVSEPRVSVQYIVAHVLGKKTLYGIDGTYELSEQDLQLINSLCLRRLQHEPVQYIIGEWSFENIELILRSPVFIPRIETEELVGMAAKKIAKMMYLHLGGRHLLEICCGSGAISLALLHKFPSLHAVAVDVSSEACNLTEENAEQLGLLRRLEIIQGNVANIEVQQRLQRLAPFDILVSNPPYIPRSNISNLGPDVLLYEELRAVDGGDNGLDVIKEVLQLAPSVLNRKSDVLLEINSGQGEQIKHMVAGWKPARLQFVSAQNDMFGKERFCHLQIL